MKAARRPARDELLNDRTGFALVTALWLVVAISAVSLELSLLSRQRRLASANVLEAASVRAAADAGLETARARLARLVSEPGTRTDRRRWNEVRSLADPWAEPERLATDSIVIGARSDETRATVTLADLGAHLHVNRASAGELQRLFAALSIDAVLADRLAQRIADWRDGDDFARPNGAEAAAYRRANLATAPANADFGGVDELRFVLGMTPQLLTRVRPFLTVDGSGKVNVNAAPRPVLLALSGFTDEAAEIAERARRAGRPIESLQALRSMLSPPARAALDNESAALTGRLVFETREVLARSVGSVTGSPVRIAAQGVIVRGGTTAFLTSRRTTWGREP